MCIVLENLLKLTSTTKTYIYIDLHLFYILWSHKWEPWFLSIIRKTINIDLLQKVPENAQIRYFKSAPTKYYKESKLPFLYFFLVLSPTVSLQLIRETLYMIISIFRGLPMP